MTFNGYKAVSPRPRYRLDTSRYLQASTGGANRPVLLSAPVPSSNEKVDLARTSHFHLSFLEEKTPNEGPVGHATS